MWLRPHPAFAMYVGMQLPHIYLETRCMSSRLDLQKGIRFLEPEDRRVPKGQFERRTPLCACAHRHEKA